MTFDLTGEVAVWRIDFRTSAPPDWSLLDARERAVADAFIHAEDRDRYGHSHCAVRRLLACFLDMEPGAVPVAVAPFGKPFIAGASRGLTFNLSHSKRTALVAIARGSAVGVDVEDDDGLMDYDEMIDAVFGETDSEHLRRESPSRRRQSFLRGWTRKEAVVKALGLGFQLDPKQFRVPLEDAGLWEVVVGENDNAQIGLSDLSEGEVIAAIAAEGLRHRPRVRPYEGGLDAIL
ncbi:4'-phosphopantetheinyl transferase [Rhodoblastus acidophilus]|uniref:4'-phosphopantetheinyl transferase family protein n=1 Tax=Rhodoblastus acidophilus TaxID=1074 RepID=UPI00222434EC|nr:4'-phosphopantetheinyl transferase superfamily protein [Rhodoblastus acidophilus]MCW2283816.1 4'-phosphopantetheinyl transferase [Rhodoblastus acidophilus]MCW2332835.1 4'-phosphopantetheinyl transferase [Rhodoblastus acidophilus]